MISTASPSPGARGHVNVPAGVGNALHGTFQTAAHRALVSEWHLALALAAVLGIASLWLLARHGGRRRRNVLAYTGLLVLVVCAGGLLVLLPARTSHSAGVRVTATEQSFVDAINRARAQHGLGPVASQAKLLEAARSHSNSMVRQQSFAHGAFWARLRSFGVPQGDAGETLAWRSSPDDAAAALIQAWLNSPEHRAILLSGTYTEVGVGVDEGSFEGYSNAIVVTADFFRPA